MKSIYTPYYWKYKALKSGIALINKLWWKFIPGITFRVDWPNGDVIVTEDHPLWDWTIGASRYIVQSADPNEHFRPWLEKNVGKQGWDWDWCLADKDVTENKLTIKFRKSKEEYATIFRLRWL